MQRGGVCQCAEQPSPGAQGDLAVIEAEGMKRGGSHQHRKRLGTDGTGG